MRRVWGDGHVHLHPEHDRGLLFARAFDVAGRAATHLLLFLVEGHGRRAFEELGAGGSGGLPAGCSARSTAEAESIAIGAPDGREVFLIGGRQIVSSEGLEVLAVGVPPRHALSTVPAGEVPAAELLQRALVAGALAGLPWGFGKWLGERGRIVSALVARDDLGNHPRFFIGDISARCRPWPVPAVFRAGPRLLPGTDLLPLPGRESRLAGYGFRLRAEFEPQLPWRSVKRALEQGAEVRPLGAPDGTLRTVWDQLRYRLRRRRSP